MIAADPAGDDVALRVDDVSIRFGRTQALDRVSLLIARGEFVALLGPNGAGKSTLIKLLDGVYQPDSGSVGTGRGRSDLAVVHQDLGLVENMTIAENMFLGAPGRRLVRPGSEATSTVRALRLVDLDHLDPYAMISSLTLAERAMIAVARAHDRGATTLIVDEVTAGLPVDQARWVVEHLAVATAHGATVVMVTHKLREVLGVASRYVVLRDGQVVLDRADPAIAREELVKVMSEGATAPRAPQQISARTDGEVVCSLRGVTAAAAGPLDLDIQKGAVTSIIGPLGSGVHEVAYVAAGVRRPDQGTVRVSDSLSRACVPAHRESEGVFGEYTVGFNVVAGRWGHWRGPGALSRVGAMRRAAEAEIESLAVKPGDLEAEMAGLSGGNQQKALLARALIHKPDLLVLCEPTRGVDVSTRQEIYARVRAEAAGGTAVLVASTDYEDIVALSDKVAALGPDGSISHWLDEAEVARISSEYV